MDSRVEYLAAQSTFAGVEFADVNGDPPVLVLRVAPTSDAYRKGVRDGDVVAKINGVDARRKCLADVETDFMDHRTEKVVGFERRVTGGPDKDDADGARFVLPGAQGVYAANWLA